MYIKITNMRKAQLRVLIKIEQGFLLRLTSSMLVPYKPVHLYVYVTH